MKQIVILGSTGSVGKSCLEVVRQYPERFKVLALAAKSNISLFEAQIREFSPKYAALFDSDACKELEGRLSGVKLLSGLEGVCEIASLREADLVLSAIVGASGLLPTLAAIKAGKRVALANKESLVMAGELIKRTLTSSGAEIIPVDSEHSAVFQCLHGSNRAELRKIWLTASGGPFRGMKKEQLETVTPEQALEHPKWKMGRRITVDSATLMNKGFEVIEAHFLFDVAVEQIGVLIHPESIVHCLVEFVDGIYLAQMSTPDMKAPIAYALSYPERLPQIVKPLDWTILGKLHFEIPNTELFPCLELAYYALREGGSMPAVLNAADEVAVDAFLSGKLKFSDIYRVIRKVMDAHRVFPVDTVEAVLEADSWARNRAKEELK